MFGKLKGLLGSNKTDAHSPKNENQRIHYRWLNHSSLFELTDSASNSFDIEDISYGGLCLNSKDKVKEGEYKLHFLTESTKVTIQEAYITKSTSGFRFVHNDAELFTFLRPIIENIRKGSSTQIVKRQFCKEPYNGKEWTVLRGEGPIDIQIDSDKETVNYTTLLDGQYKAVFLENSKLKTYKEVDKEGLSTRMANTSGLEKHEIIQIVAQIQGINQNISDLELLQSLKNELIKSLN